MEGDTETGTALAKETEIILDKGTAVVQLTKQSTEHLSSPETTRKNRTRSLCTIVLRCTSIIVILALYFAIPIAQLVIDILYQDQCPINNIIPTYLIGTGLIGITTGVIVLSQQFFCQKEPAWLCLMCPLILFGTGWFIAGNVWVVKARTWVQFKDPAGRNTYCHKTPFTWAWIAIIIGYMSSAFVLAHSYCRRSS